MKKQLTIMAVLLLVMQPVLAEPLRIIDESNPVVLPENSENLIAPAPDDGLIHILDDEASLISPAPTTQVSWWESIVNFFKSLFGLV